VSAIAERTLELIDVASESREEAALAAHVLDVLATAGARDAGDLCIVAGATERTGDRPLVLLAGHLDTVPAQGNRPGRIDDDAVHGLGACDMKGALAVMVELALAPPPDAAVDLGFVFFPREELAFGDTALTPLLEREAGLAGADLAIVMEPTANALQAGCLGNLNATWTFRGTAGHSARPWLADNAVHRLGRGIAAVAEVAPRPHEFEGLEFVEVTSVTQVHGGIARNVVPDEAVALVNHRYPPGRTPQEAESVLRALCEPHGELRIDGHAPSGTVPPADHPLVRALRRAAGDAPLAPKQAWTPVAEFAAAGVAAINFGPGDPRFAHRRDEQVAIEALERSLAVLMAFAGCA
jgi:succinyl-diaminopimelate desuccinylase